MRVKKVATFLEKIAVLPEQIAVFPTEFVTPSRARARPFSAGTMQIGVDGQF
jgi:hypothetical protein